MGLRSWFKWMGEDLIMKPITELLWPRTSAGVVLVKDGKILGLDVGDYYTLPIGGSDRGETFRDTAIRETLEETGLEVEINDRIVEQINSNGGVEALFTAEIAGGELDGNFFEGTPEWIDIEEAAEHKWRYNRDIDDLIRKAQKKEVN